MIVKTKKLMIKRQRRPTWEEYFMEKVDVTAKRSACIYYHIGAVFVDGSNKHDLVSGYNGPPPGEDHCCDVGCSKEDEHGKMLPPGSHKCVGNHAEMNAVFNAVTRGITLKDVIIYCTFSPCRDCARHLISLHPTQFIYKFEYKDDFEEVSGLFRRRGIELIKFKGGNNGQK